MGSVDGLHRMTRAARRGGRSAAVAAALALIAFLAVACSSDGPPPQAPEGFTRFEHPSYTFVYPVGWEILEADGHADPTSEVEMLGEPREGFRLELRLYRTEGLPESYTTESFMTVLNALSNLEVRERRVVADEPFAVPGAAEARLVESAYLKTLRADEVPMRQFDLVVLRAGGQLIDLRVGGRERDVDERQMRVVVDSFRLRG